MRPHGKYAVVNPDSPEAFAQCDRCGFWRNRGALVWQTQWAGQQLYNVQVLVCEDRCFDTPNEQLRTIVLPPDPPPIQNARPPNLSYEESGPVQATLTSNVSQGALALPVSSVEGFEVGQFVWIQLNNSMFAQAVLDGVDANSSILSIVAPLPFSAPYTGTVTVADVAPSLVLSGVMGGSGALVVEAVVA